MALSTTDTNKWLTLIESRLVKQIPEVINSSDYQLVGPISQRQRRLTKAQVIDLAARYEAGATVYELAAEFGCHRTTVSARLKEAGVRMRLQPPPDAMIDEMVRRHESGLSFGIIGKVLRVSPQTVRRYVKERGVGA